MKKILISILLIFAFLPFVKARDDRDILEGIEATSNYNTIIGYNETMEEPTFNITVGSEAHFDLREGRWYQYNGSKWLSRTNGYKFSSGSWHYRVKVVLDGVSGESYRLGSTTTIKINGENWTFNYMSTGATENSSYGYATSPTIVLDEPDDLYFFEHETYYIYINYVNIAISPIDVSGSVEGGVEPYTFEKVSGPSWLSVSEAGVVSGTPVSVGENEDLIIRVTDAENAHKEITMPISKTILPPGLREEILNVTATSNITSVLGLGNDIVRPTFNITEGTQTHFSTYDGGWYKKVGSNWVLSEGKFTPGIWQYKTQVLLDGEEANDYRLSDNTTVFVDEIDWQAELSGVGDSFFSVAVKSPEYIIGGKINSIEIYGDITAPSVGQDIVDPSIGIYTVNNDQELINFVDVEAKWQYKTGDGFFDWADASGKFEDGKTYHIRIMITVLGDVYELENIATFPVTFEGYELTQFQLNNKTVGEFIEFNELKEISKPNVSIKNDNNKITLSWDSQSAAIKYRVYRSTDGKKYSKVADVTTNSYTDKSLTYGKTYYYKVRVYDENGKKIYSDAVSKKIKPNKPVLNIKSAGTNNVKLEWSKVKVTGYQIARSTDNKNWSNIKTITKNSTLEYNNKSLKANKTYYYKIRAYKTVSGKKVYGSWSTVVSTKTAPNKPTFEVKLKDYNAMNLVIGYSKGTSEYRVYRSLDDKNWERIETLPVEGTLADADHEVGKMYYYKVKACNSLGNCSGYVYKELKQTVKTPKITLESTTKKKVNITISSVNMAEGYKVYRSTSKNGKYELIKEITDPSELTFTDKTKSGYTYYYKTRAYSRVDGSKVFSPYSSIKSVKSK